jgi:PAS domain S-box-containing protein
MDRTDSALARPQLPRESGPEAVRRVRQGLHRVARRTAVIYGVAALVWILLTDRVVSSLTADATAQTQLDVLKDLFAATVTTMLLYALLRAQFRTREAEAARLAEAENSSREARDRLDLAMAAASLGAWEWSFETDRTYWTPECFHILGKSESTTSSRDVLRSIHGEDFGPARALLQRAIAEHGLFRAEFRVRRVDGETRWIESVGRADYDDHGRAVRFVGTVQDITVRREAELSRIQLEDEMSERLALQDQLANVAASVPGMVCTFRRSPGGGWTIPFTSAAIVELFGLSPADVHDSAAPLWGRIHPDHSASVRDAFSSPGITAAAATLEFRVVHPARGERWIEAHATSKVSADGALELYAFLHDITEQKAAESSRAQAQKLEAIGTLASGIAHDFNNILHAIDGNARLIGDEIDALSPAHGNLRDLTKATRRAADLVRRILAFSLPRERDIAAREVGPVVDEALRLLRATLPAGLMIDYHCDEPLPPAAIDSTQMHQVIVNLVTNASHAIGSRKGRIGIRLSAVEVSASSPVVGANLTPGRYVTLAVEDNGSGMDEPTLARIFDPFFTTKSVGVGTGLGLSVVHGIMKVHHGAIVAESTLGLGATFRLYFPVATTAVASSAVRTRTSGHGRGERVLYIDDEPTLVRLAERSLSRRGFTVVGFSDPTAAIVHFTAAPQSIDVVVTDLSMPGMSGLDLAREIAAIRPGIPIVLTSGFLKESDAEEARRVGIASVVLKPNTAEELGRVLSGLLEARS